MAIIAQQVPKEVFENLKWVEMSIQEAVYGHVQTDLDRLTKLLKLKVSYINEMPNKGEREYLL